MVLGHIILVSGDPIGPKEDLLLLIKEFKYFIKGAGLTSCFVGVQKETLLLLSSFGYKEFYAGEEAVVSLLEYDKSRLKRKVRRAEKHILMQGISTEVYSRSTIPAHFLDQIETLSQKWLHFKGKREIGFSMTLGRVPGIMDTDCEFVLAVQDNTIVGYLTFVPVYPSNGLSLDEMRRSEDCPNGLMEFLLLQAFAHYKTKGIGEISLNFAAFHQKEINDPGWFSHFQALLYKGLGKYLYGNNIYRFNKKFLPDWKSRYIAFEQRIHIPLYILAIARTELNFA